MRLFPLLIAGAAFAVAACSAAPPAATFRRGENLALPVPAGYVQVFHDRKESLDHREMVPQGESATDWSEMVTVQIFFGGVPQKTPELFAEWLSAAWKQSCPNAETGTIDGGTTKGYPWTYWFMDCPKSPRSGKREYTRAMAFAGDKSFYVAQKAWAFEPSVEQLQKWNDDFFSYLHVCDTTQEGAQCPQGEAK